jgi:hypothetical protein
MLRMVSESGRETLRATDAILIALPLSGEVAEWPKALAC